MTCIVGLVDEATSSVIVGGDSLAVSENGFNAFSVDWPKVFSSNGFIIGYTSSFRMGQILEWRVNLDRHAFDASPMSYMVHGFIPEIRKAFKEEGFLKTDSGVETGGAFLIARGSKLFVVESDFQVMPRNNYAAVGCGLYAAVGALYALSHTDIVPKAKVTIALCAAEAHTSNVRGPFKILSTREK